MILDSEALNLDFIDQEARAKYKARRQQDLARCRQFLNHRDFSGLETIGHNLKGNGISFGYPELSKLGENLEKSAKASDLDSAKKLVDHLENWIEEQDPSQTSH